MLKIRRNYVLAILMLFWAVVVPAAKPPMAAPDFSLPDINGEPITLSGLQGRNVLFLFGSTTCPHCEEVFPKINDFSRSVGDEVKIFFIAVRQSGPQVMDFFGGQFPSFGILPDETAAVSRLYNINRVPTCVFIDEQGLLQYTGRPDVDIFWRLLSGERLNYPDTAPSDLSALDRFAKPSKSNSRRSKRFIVELDEEPSASRRLSKNVIKSRRGQFRKAADGIGGHIIHNYGTWNNKIVIEMPDGRAEKLKQLPQFKSFKEDRRVYALLEDSAYQIKADYAWDNAITGEGVKVCVVDTGIDYTHPDLLNKVVAQINVTDANEDAMDDNGHGTHCAGIIASEGFVYRGVSYDVALMAAKVLNYSGEGYASDVAIGINWCVEQGADIISLSLGEGLFSGSCDEEEMAQAVNHAVDPCGVVVVCAAGNDGNPNAMVSPACASKAIAVGAVDKLDNIASYSDGGSELDVVAPGGDMLGGINYPEITSTFSTLVANNPFYCMYQLDEDCYDNYFIVDGSRYIRAIGTSMAAPHVAGAAALLLEENPHLTPTQVKEVLELNADDLGPVGRDNVFGWGRINIQKALENIPPELAELKVTITEPNVNTFSVYQPFDLAATIDCFGGDGCGDVLVYGQFCEGLDCNNFIDINDTTIISTLDNNPNELGILSGYTFETDVPVIFDARTTLDISEQTYTKFINPATTLVGSMLPGLYNSGDLEPQDGVGAIGDDVEAHYEFEIPAGTVKTLKVRMENYLVMHFDYPPFAGWYVYTSNSNADNLQLVGDCIPAEGGGGETPPPDCWFICDDPNVLADLNPGTTNYIKLVSHDVGDNDWLTFNDIEVIIEYEIDPNNDEVFQYYLKFDINDIDPSQELTAARLRINVALAAQDALAEIHLVDNSLLATDSAQLLHEANSPSYSSLINPIKSFSCENTGTISLNVKAAIAEALATSQDSIAFVISERNNDQLVAIDANNSQNSPELTISQKSLLPPGELPGGEVPDVNNGPRPLVYDTMIVKDVNDDTYVKYDSPGSAVIGAAFDLEYNTGDLEPNDGIGAIEQNAEELYQFQIPAGVLSTLKVRMENYLVMHFDYPPFAGWYVYTSNANGDNLHLVGDCIPAEGGGGGPVSPDCWFVSGDANTLADLNPGQTSYIKLVSHDVGGNDWLTFNDIEVIAEYQVDPDNDKINRYYVKFDISSITPDARLDSATLNLYVTEPNAGAGAEVHLVQNTYDPCTAAQIIYNAEDADYSVMVNPIKTISCATAGLKQINVKSALEDALAGGEPNIAFLITEQNENALFTIEAEPAPQEPYLNVYFKSEISSGQAQWNILPSADGKFTLRVKAINNVGITGVSDAFVINVYDPNLPVINGIDCLINSTWKDCRDANYGDNLQQIRIDATDLQETPDVQLILRNIPDDHNFVDAQLTYSGGYFTHNTNLTIQDSGDWQINVTATDSDDNSDTETITWRIPWGSLDSYLISPTGDITVPKSGNFDVQAGVQCLDAECPDVNFSIVLNNPLELKYDDAGAESYGDIGSTEGYLAVGFTPQSYPMQLITARFYVYDTTTYPFEINIRDDNGYDWQSSPGAPGTNMVTPFVVDPVVTSTDEEVAWFDVDLSQHNIIINSGDFYIGVRQIEDGKLNQLGFDMQGGSYVPYGRSWAYLPLVEIFFGNGWFNLDSLLGCQSDPNFCGNLMVRAMMAEPGTFSGQLPETIGPAILYTTDDHPSPCPNPDMAPEQTCQTTITVHAVGPAGQYTKIHVLAANNYSSNNSAAIKVTITEPSTPCDAVNLDAVFPIDGGDLEVLAGEWLDNTPPLFADIYTDGAVNLKDLALLAQYWLNSQCP